MNWNSAICSNMDRPRDCHIEWVIQVRQRQTSHDITDIWNLQNMIQVKLFTNRNRVTVVENKFMVNREEKGVTGETGIDIHTTIYKTDN